MQEVKWSININMIKKCNVLLNNEVVTVVDYDGVKVQFPSIHKNSKTVNVIYKNGQYIIVEEDYIEPTVETELDSESKLSKNINKKTTIKSNKIDKIENISTKINKKDI